MSVIERYWHRWVLRHEQSEKDLSNHFIDTEGQLNRLIRCQCGRSWAR